MSTEDNSNENSSKNPNGPKTIEHLIENFDHLPFDARWPQWNKHGLCRQYFIDYHRCMSVKSAKGESPYPCQYFKKAYISVCPFVMIEKWQDQVEQGIFPAKLETDLDESCVSNSKKCMPEIH